MSRPLSHVLMTVLVLTWLPACSSPDPAATDARQAGTATGTVEAGTAAAGSAATSPTDTPSAAGTPSETAVTDAHAERSPSGADTLRKSIQAPAMNLAVAPASDVLGWAAPENRERYRHVESNGVKLAAVEPVSTFSIDVDTAAYSNVRRLLSAGALPPSDAVRVEELVNYFSYDYPNPAQGRAFEVVTEIGPVPWHPQRRLLHVGIQGARIDRDALPPANLVFLIDVSGSMQSPDKIGLLKTSLKLLTAELDADDRISLVVYAGAAGAVLPPTPGSRRAEINAAIDRLSAGGSTNGAAGIELAYALARQSFHAGGINRVILATDGDFNVGTTDVHALEDLVARERRSGVALTVLGFGAGNYNDALMQTLAQTGDGNAAYLDTLNEARKVLVDELAATLSIIARDVKIQVEFNPAVVAEYRLLGYETRLLRREDFNNDQVDAGEIGAGHTVTALYELTLRGGGGRQVDPLRYGAAEPASAGHADELAYVRIRHKAPDADTSTLIEKAVRVADIRPTLARTSDDFRFAAAVAAFGELLRGEAHTGDFTYDDVAALAGAARGADASGYRGEFLGLVRTAAALAVEPAAETDTIGDRSRPEDRADELVGQR